jgi:hypothetical protein
MRLVLCPSCQETSSADSPAAIASLAAVWRHHVSPSGSMRTPKEAHQRAHVHPPHSERVRWTWASKAAPSVSTVGRVLMHPSGHWFLYARQSRAEPARDLKAGVFSRGGTRRGYRSAPDGASTEAPSRHRLAPRFQNASIRRSRRPSTAGRRLPRQRRKPSVYKAFSGTERAGFEPAMECSAPYSLSRRVPSAARPPLLRFESQSSSAHEHRLRTRHTM